MHACAIAVTKQRVLALRRVELIEGRDAFGRRLHRRREIRYAGDRRGAGRRVVVDPGAVGVERVDVILRGREGSGNLHTGAVFLPPDLVDCREVPRGPDPDITLSQSGSCRDCMYITARRAGSRPGRITCTCAEISDFSYRRASRPSVHSIFAPDYNTPR